MNFRDLLLKEHSRNNGLKAAQAMLNDTNLVNECISYLTDQKVLQQRSSQALCYLVEVHKYPLSAAQRHQLIKVLKNDTLHDSVYRNLLKIIDFQFDFSDDDQAFLFDYCVQVICNLNKSIAIRAFSIPVAYRVAEKHRGLVNELKNVLESIPNEDSAGMQVRKRTFLQKLELLCVN